MMPRTRILVMLLAWTQSLWALDPCEFVRAVPYHLAPGCRLAVPSGTSARAAIALESWMVCVVDDKLYEISGTVVDKRTGGAAVDVAVYVGNIEVDPVVRLCGRTRMDGRFRLELVNGPPLVRKVTQSGFDVRVSRWNEDTDRS